MFLPSCEQIALEQPGSKSLIEALDHSLRQMGPDGDIDLTDLALALSRQPHEIEPLLERLVEVGGLRIEPRIRCPNGCCVLSTDDFADNGGEPVVCEECDAIIQDVSGNRVSVYVISESVSTAGSIADSNIPDGDALDPSYEHPLLFATANPQVDSTLALGKEWQGIQQRLDSRQCSVNLKRSDWWATTLSNLQQRLLDEKPEIVHFSGHGHHLKGLEFHSDNVNQNISYVSKNALADLFKLVSGTVKCVFLNTCHSKDQASAIAPHIHCVIGINGEIDDGAAVKLSHTFYTALTAGQPFGRSFEQAVLALKLDNDPDVDLPCIWIDGLMYTVPSQNSKGTL